mgnify:CR=1 FL=1
MSGRPGKSHRKKGGELEKSRRQGSGPKTSLASFSFGGLSQPTSSSRDALVVLGGEWVQWTVAQTGRPWTPLRLLEARGLATQPLYLPDGLLVSQKSFGCPADNRALHFVTPGESVRLSSHL